MKIGFNPQAATQAQNARGPQAQPTSPAPEGVDEGGVEITLSQAAKNILKSDVADYDGKSPAHMARAAMAMVASGEAVEGLSAESLSGPFGQIVKTFFASSSSFTT